MTNQPELDDELTLGDLWAMIAPRMWLIAVAAVIGAAIGVGISFLVRPTFSADILLAPVSQSGAGGGAAAMLNSQYSGLASLAGINLPGVSGATAQQEAIATLQSRQITNAFIESKNLLPELYPSRWDAENKRWKNADPDRVPTLWEAERLFDAKIRTVAPDKKTGLVTMTIRWSNPKEAAEWTNDLVERTNTYLREKAIERAQQNLQFLQQQLEKTSVVEVRQAIYRLMENEIKTLTLAQGAKEYAFKVIDPAVVPRRKVAPSRPMFLIGGFLAGLMLSMLYALVKAPKKIQSK